MSDQEKSSEIAGEEQGVGEGNGGATVPTADIACSDLVSIPSCGVVDCEPASSNPEGTLDEVGYEHSAKLDELGPIILNTDGTMGRISNWAQFTETERAQALRLVAARNKKRKEALLRERSSGAGNVEGV
jgi:hypothetical protein